MAQVILDHTSTREDVVALLQANDISAEDFDREGNKTVDDLVQELQDHDVTLYQHPETGRIIRSAHSVKLLILVGEGCLLETMRLYANGRPVDTKGLWSISETQKIGEDGFDAVIRGVKQELKRDVTKDQLKPVPRFDPESRQMRLFTADEYESSVYHRIRSRVNRRRFIWESDKPLDSTTIVKDGNVHVFINWFQHVPPSVIEDWFLAP